MITHKSTAATEEESLERFYNTVAKYGHTKDEFTILSIKKDGRGTWTISYERARKPSTELPNAQLCDACRAWNPNKGCSEGSRPGTCGHSITISTAATSEKKPIISAPAPAPPPTVDQVPVELPLSAIVISGRNPRKHFDKDRLHDLEESIRAHGVVQPIVVRRKGSKYELIIGERRVLAARDAGLQKIPVIVREFSDAQLLEVMLVENLQREDLDPIEEAEAIRQLLEDGHLTQTELGRRLGKSQDWISLRLRLLECPEELRSLVTRRLVEPSAAADVLGKRDDPAFPTLIQALREEAEQHGKVTQARTRELIKGTIPTAPSPPIVKESEPAEDKEADSEAELVEKERLAQIDSRSESYENSYEKPEPASAMPPRESVLPTELPTDLPTECHVLSCGEQTEPGGHWCSEHLTPESRKPKETAEEPDPNERRIVTRAQYALQGRRLFLNPGDERPPKFEELPEVL
ncbi:MAG: ParB/RepB/Spo0J family partition protein [Methanomassiliicoccales archaeon]|nr:ParB/RepB/Spo0J family partition protein [Methanomassiliicoccales archaeon]